MNINVKCIGETAHPHTIKKFELIDAYIKKWAETLLNYDKCNGIIFIDCMCNCGIYCDENGNGVCGTPIRVAKTLQSVAEKYLNKKVNLIFNDISEEKIEVLTKYLPPESDNFKISLYAKDGNVLLKELSTQLRASDHMNFFLLYDPYEASIDWDAIAPYLQNWGEVLINHMVYDSIRAIPQVKTPKATDKYQNTYLSWITELVPFGSDRKAYEKRIEEIITKLKGNSEREYYLASFPFFNSKNASLYDLVFCTSNKKGFKIFKQTAWNTFGGRSSIKRTSEDENQTQLNFEGNGIIKTNVDENCYCVKDIADYLYMKFVGRSNVNLGELWECLDAHPVFPSDGYKNKIKKELKELYGVKFSRSSAFIDGIDKNEVS